VENTGNFIRGAVELMILNILQYGDSYGYRLSQLIEKYSDGFLVLPVGTLYPSLYRMEKKGYISFDQKITGRRLRTYYHILDPGKEYLATLRTEYEDVNRSIHRVLDESDQHKGDME
jgi:PadR family transcriptional regulator PadR